MAVVLTSFRPTLQVAGFTFIDLTTLIIITGQYSGAGNRWSTLRAMTAITAVGYQVTNGKSLVLRAARTVVQASAIYPATLLYGDTDVGQNSGSAPTNPKYSGNDTSYGQIPQTATGQYECVLYNFSIASQKYGAIYNAGGANSAHHICYGYES